MSGKIDGRINNGGKRDGSGRKPLLDKEEILRVKELLSQHSAEVDETDLEKRERVLVLMDKLYEEGKAGNIMAIKEYLDRQMGKAKDNLDITTGGEKIGKMTQKELDVLLEAYANKQRDKIKSSEKDI